MKLKKIILNTVFFSLIVASSATFVISCGDTTNKIDDKNTVVVVKNKNDMSTNDKQETTTSETENNNLPPKLNQERFVYDKTNNYYETLDGLKGAELRKALIKLQEVNAKKQTHEYRDLPRLYSRIFRDKYYDKDNSLVDIYSEVNGKDPYLYPEYTSGRSSARAEGQGTNREHIIPQSWFNQYDIPRADAHFVVPSDIFVNAKRGNFPHDYVESDIVFTSLAGGKLGKNTLGEMVFEPQDMVKGDIARAYFYYTFTYASWIDSTNNISFFTNEEPYIPMHYLNVYKKWHGFDAIDEFNIHVNNGIAGFSNGLRNPFVDYPDLFENLFGENPKPFVNKGVLASVKNAE